LIREKSVFKLQPSTHSAKVTYLLVTLVLATLFFQWQIHRGNDFFDSRRAGSVETAKPVQVGPVFFSFPNTENSGFWQFNYSEIEKALQELQFSDSGDLIYNPHTADIMLSAVNKIDKNIDQENLDRLVFLTKKSESVDTGEKLANLLISFYYYTNHDNSHDLKPLDLQQQIILQQQYFGVLEASQLFARKNAIRAYFEKRQHIQRSTNLNATQKQSALLSLEKEFSSDSLYFQ